MNCRIVFSGLLLSLATGLAGAPAQVDATTIHTWTDADGVTHFSDSPPEGTQPSAILEIADDFPIAPDSEDDYYSVANQWQRLKAERDAASARRLERDKLRAEERARLASLAAQSYAYPDNYQSYPVYPYGYGGGYGRGHLRPPYGGPYPRDGYGRHGDPGRHHGHRRGLKRSSANAGPGAAPPPSQVIRRPPVGYNSSARFHVRF